jgi:hypothetical protein
MAKWLLSGPPKTDMKFYVIVFVAGFVFFSCKIDNAASDRAAPFSTPPPKQTDIEVLKLGTGTNFKFKGLAVDTKEMKAYLGSWDKKEIVVVSLKDIRYETLKTKYSGVLNGMGCYLKNGKLYALMNEIDDTPTAQPVSVLLVFDLNEKKLISSFECKGVDGRNHFNHVVVDNNGLAYVSNTLKSSIYIVNTNDAGDRLKKLIEHKDLGWVHGIDLSPDGRKLFTTAYDGGIKFLDLQTLKFSSYSDTTLAGDDGLKYHNGFLYGVGQNMIRKYTLDTTENSVIGIDTVLYNHEYFNDPRCLHIEGGTLYCLANIESEPVFFNRKGKYLRNTPLTDSYLIKMRITD